VFSAGSPGSAVGLCLDGVGIGAASVPGLGEGDESGFCGRACRPTPGVETGEDAGFGEESGCCGNAGSSVFGVATGDGTGVWARSGPGRLTARHPSASKRLFTGTNLLVGMLVQSLWAFAVSWEAAAGNLRGAQPCNLR